MSDTIRSAVRILREQADKLEATLGDDAAARGIDTSADGSITITSNPAGKAGVNTGASRTDVLREK